MAKLKSLFSGDNLKRFLLKHGEKFVLGFVGLFVLMALAGTQWAGYKKPPLELVQNLQQADVIIEGATWPEEEQAKYPILNVQEDVDQMLAEMSDRPYVFSTHYISSVFGADEPRREPELLTVMDLIASSGRTVLAQKTEMANPVSGDPLLADAAIDDPVAMDNEADNIPDDLRARPTGGSLLGSGEMGSGPGGNPYGRAGGYEEQYMVSYDPSAMVLDSGMGGMGEGMGMGLPSNVKGTPVRYISVRGVFDLRKQVQNYAKALGVPETEAGRLVQFLDFHLERQVANSPQGPWGEWEPVDIAVAIDYANQAADYDPDVVSVGVRDTVITMPLPARLMGVWRNMANHPAVKNFELSEAEIEAEMVFNRQILEQARDQNKALKQRRTPGGFNNLQLDMANIQQDYLSQTDARQVTRAFDDEFKGTPAEVRKKLIDKIKAQVSAVGNLVLFRYIDFDLQPEKSYRYRVSLVLQNPNYEQPVERVVHPSVVEGETRETPVSKPSNVASVEPDYAYFVSRVNPPRGIASKQADLQVFQWYDKTGTMIKGNLTLEPGDFISGTAKTHVLDPAALKFEEEEAPLSTSDLLVDALVLGKLDTRLHSDLKLPKNLTRGEIGIAPQVLVVNHKGNLQELNAISQSRSQKQYETNYDLEKGPFITLKDASKKMSQGSELDMLMSGEGDPMMEEMYGTDGANRLRGRKRNPTRRQMDPMMMQMGP